MWNKQPTEQTEKPKLEIYKKTKGGKGVLADSAITMCKTCVCMHGSGGKGYDSGTIFFGVLYDPSKTRDSSWGRDREADPSSAARVGHLWNRHHSLITWRMNIKSQMTHLEGYRG